MTTSEQARAAAMADAETLRWFTYSLIAEINRGLRSERRIRVLMTPQALRPVPSIVTDIHYANAENIARLSEIWNFIEETTVSQVRDAARAAFRAVPGLRG